MVPGVIFDRADTHDARQLSKRLYREVCGTLLLSLRDIDDYELEGDILLLQCHENGGDSADGAAGTVELKDHDDAPGSGYGKRRDSGERGKAVRIMY
jgi:hypothetical protein